MARLDNTRSTSRKQEHLMSDNPAKKAAEERAAERRADYVRALEEEREGYKRRSLDDRVKQVDAEIARVKKAPVGRSASGDKSDA